MAMYFQEESPLQETSTRYPISGYLHQGRTRFADVAIVNSNEYGRMLFLDSELQSASSDERIYHETLVHPVINSMYDRDDMRVLVVGGAEGATVREVLKWSPNKVAYIDWVDIDADLVELCRNHLCYTENEVYANHRVRYYGEDIMNFLEDNRSADLYDVIIIDLPDPDPQDDIDLYRNRFWRLITRALTPGGAVVTHCGPVTPGRLGNGSGLDYVRNGMYSMNDPRYQNITPYHTYIPSFQGEWGFVMSRRPAPVQRLPDNCVIMNNDYQNTIFHWDRHWGLD